ncbi:MAG: GH32 C-terminal domain-containing protein [Prolixibacteraceae bacterium]|nr:GH32 C-terminal domain-containing protein [Prolixibacteraceae bacterium]
MKQGILIIIALFTCLQVFPRKSNIDEKFNEPYRPQFHFTTETNKLGAPIGILKKDSVFHLFYQHNPHNFQNGFYNWGHATSSDLLHWEFRESVLQQTPDVSDSMLQTPWWGTIISHDHTFSAWYNSWGEGILKTAANDEFSWWKKDKIEGAGFLKKCEPFVFWHEASQKWVMMAYNRADSTLNILNSEEGLNWKKISDFYFKFGFPGLIELPVDRKNDDTRWMFFTEKGNYLLAAFDGEKLELLTPLRKFDYGKDVGASVCYFDQENDRYVMLSELECEQLPDLPSNGQFTFPTEISLHESSLGVEAFRKPSREIETLFEKSFTWEAKKVYPGIDNNILSKLRNDTYYIKGSIDLMNCDQFGFIIRCGRDKDGTEINYHVGRNLLSLLGNRIDYKPMGSKFDFEILIDRSSIELFVEGGRYVISTSFTPDPDKNRYMLYTIGGEIMVDYLEVHQLKSVWNENK